MATQPRSDLPLFYNDLTPLSSAVHGDWKMRNMDRARFLSNVHAVPLLAEEFVQASRDYPIVFSSGPDPVPLALMGLNEGVNTFVDAEGKFADGAYVPAYVRRYPFMLAKLRPDTDDLSLCVDPTSEVFNTEEGEPIFEANEPTQGIKNVLTFCEQFERSSQVTGGFIRELIENKLLIDGEFTVQPEGSPQPYIYRGFQLVPEEGFRNIRGDVARKLVQSGAMALIFAHFFSLQRMGDIFARQQQQGAIPTEFPVA